tara:strand:+ start:318 stop:1514 length:1197 start_codon:yes stop_codon:yes gene_type:complete
MVIFIIFLIITILIVYYKQNTKKSKIIEHNSNIVIPRVEYKNINKFLPINMIINPMDNQNIDNNFVISANEIQNVLEKIKKTTSNIYFDEIPKFTYSYGNKIQLIELEKNKIDKLIDSLYKKLKKELENYLYDNKKKQCNSFNKCIIKNRISKILKIGKKNKDVMIEGQILLGIAFKPIEFLIRFVINTQNNLSINYLKLEGFDFIKNLPSNTDFKSIYDKNFVNIYKSPLINKYNTNNSYFLDSNEEKILNSIPENNKILNNREERKLSTYICYGKNAKDKNTCESQYDKNGKKYNNVGVWDKPCRINNECPFYKKNTNYPNEFGGCLNGRCEMPLGLDNISPRRYLDIKNAICYNCKKGSQCCEEQRDRKLYPNLKSPDYHFKNDKTLRYKYFKEV